jgi:hypothetical protein
VSWNFRIIRHKRPGGGESFTIHEAYYDTDISDQQEMNASKRPNSICPEPHNAMGLSLEELRKDLMLMLNSLNRPPVEGENYHVRVRYERKRNKSVAEDLNREVRQAKREAKDWKKAYLKANSERIDLQKQIDDLQAKLEPMDDDPTLVE